MSVVVWLLLFESELKCHLGVAMSGFYLLLSSSLGISSLLIRILDAPFPLLLGICAQSHHFSFSAFRKWRTRAIAWSRRVSCISSRRRDSSAWRRGDGRKKRHPELASRNNDETISCQWFLRILSESTFHCKVAHSSISFFREKKSINSARPEYKACFCVSLLPPSLSLLCFSPLFEVLADVLPTRLASADAWRLLLLQLLVMS